MVSIDPNLLDSAIVYIVADVQLAKDLTIVWAVCSASEVVSPGHGIEELTFLENEILEKPGGSRVFVAVVSSRLTDELH
jgi:hypothetical protein